MRSKAVVVCSFLMLSAAVLLVGQGPPPAAPALPPQTISLPTFTSNATVAGTNYTYTLLGGDPAKGGTTTIPTVLAAITLTIDAPMDAAGRKAVLDAGPIARTGDPLADLRRLSLRIGDDAVCRRDDARRFPRAGRQRRLAHAPRATQGRPAEDRGPDRSRVCADVEEDRPHARHGGPALHAAGDLQAAAEGCRSARRAPAGGGARHDVLRQFGCDAVLPLGHLWRRYLGGRAAAVRAGHLSGPERGGRRCRRAANHPAARAVLPRSVARPAVSCGARRALSGQCLPRVDEGAGEDRHGAAATEQCVRRQRHRQPGKRSDRCELEEHGAGVEAVRRHHGRRAVSPAERRAAPVVQPERCADVAPARLQLS